MHLSKSYVKIGDIVTNGVTLIGETGAKGVPGSPHLHVEMRSGFKTGGAAIDVACSNDYDPRLILELCPLPINNGLSFYAGSVTSPDPIIEITYKLPGIVHGINISGLQIDGKDIPYSVIDHEDYRPETGEGYFEIHLTSQILSAAGITQNKAYNISFDVDNNLFAGSNQIIFTDLDNITDVALDDWFSEYVRTGVRLGLFNCSGGLFKPKDNLSRAQAAKVIVSIAVQLNLMQLNTSTANGKFDDVLYNDWAFPYVQTLRNYGYISAGTKFLPNDFISAGAFAKILCNALKITSADINTNQLNNSGIIHSLVQIVSPDFQQYLDNLLKIVVIKDDMSGDKFVESLASGLGMIKSTDLNGTYIQFNGNNYIPRAIMAKVLLNAYLYRQQNPISGTGAIFKHQYNDICDNIGTHGPSPSLPKFFAPLGTNTLAKYTIVGDKFELTAETSGTAPQTLTATFTMESGQTKDIGLESEYINGVPCFFYWVSNGGLLTDLFPNNNHRKVRFTAPTVTQSTTYGLYLYIGTGNGKAYQASIKIVVNPTGTSITAPTVPSSNISFSNFTYSSTTMNWNRGDGQFCLVACTERGINYDDPQANTLYIGNSDFNIATSMISGSSTKVVYTGTGNSVTVSNLKSGTTYDFVVYEYNGNTIQNVRYLYLKTSNSFRIPTIPKTTVDFNWDPNPIIAGKSCRFSSGGSNYTNSSWIFSGANITNSNLLDVSGVIFNNAGTYNITLTNSNSQTGQSATITKSITVVKTDYILPDLVINSLTIPTTFMAGSTVPISFYIGNNGLTAADHCWTRLYLSNDDVFDGSDILIGNIYYPNQIAGNQSVLQSFNYNSPTDISGTKYLIAYADYAAEILEGIETNNIATVQISVSAWLPDFSISNISLNQSTVQAGGQVTVNYTLNGMSGGQGSGYVAFYLNSAMSLEGAIDIPTGFLDFNSSSGAGTYSHIITLPSYLKSGNYYVGVKADFSDMVKEVNENNNVSFIPITVSNVNQPTISSTNLKLSNITANSATLSWSNGNGQNRIVVVSTSECGLPSDGVTYSANSNYTSGTKFGSCGVSKVVYNGSGTTVNITGLSENADYYVYVCEYNGSGTSTNYFQDGGGSSGSCEFAKYGMIFKTLSSNANASSWSLLTNSYITGGYLSNSRMYFINDQIGWIANYSYILKTIDGGSTWTFNYLGFSVNAMNFISPLIGWCVTDNGGVFKTIDGGLTWTKQNSNTKDAINDVYFINEYVGYFVTTGNNNDVTGKLYKTTNGGTTWLDIYDSPNRLLSIHFLNSNIGWVSGTKSTLLKTIDGGATWSMKTVTTEYFYYLISLVFTTENVGWAIPQNQNGNILKTTDGGNTWTQNKIANNSLYDIKFINDKIGYAIGANEISKTIDGGVTWINYPTSFDGKSFYTINENTIYAGYYGVFKTTTASQSQFINSPTLTNTSICTPASFNTNYTISGTFNSGNIFTAQLSDVNGSFDNPVSIGTITSNSTGSISCNIPAGLTAGTNYKIRIVASNPATVGASTTVSLNPTPVVNITEPSQSNYVTTASAVTMVGSPTGGTFTINNGAATQFNPAALGAGTYTVAYTYTLNGCSGANSKTVTVSVPQTISITNLSPVAYCAGANATVNYTINGIFAADNTFTVQLSNAVGDFTNATSIQSVTSSVAGAISFQMPVTSAQGSGYMVRVVSSNPQVVSNASNGFTINAAVAPSVTLQSNKTEICASGTVLFTATQLINGGTSPQYKWKINHYELKARSIKTAG